MGVDGWVGACVRVRALARACVYGVCGVSQAIGAGYHGYPMEKIEKRHKTQNPEINETPNNVLWGGGRLRACRRKVLVAGAGKIRQAGGGLLRGQ